MAEDLARRVSEDLGLNGLDDDEVEMVDPPQNQDQEQQESIRDKCFSAYNWCDVIEAEGVKIKHTLIDDLEIDEVTELILCELRSQEPRRISVACYHVFLKRHSVQEIMEQLAIVTAAAQQTPTHKIVFCTTIFLPEHQQTWGEQCKLNFEIRRLCLVMKRPCIPIHKVGLLVQSENKGCMIRKSCFTEATTGNGLGLTLNVDTMGKIKSWIVKYHRSGFEQDVPLGWKMSVWDLKPISLQQTVGYKNPRMIEFLKAQGTFKQKSNIQNKTGAAVRGRRSSGSVRKELGIKPAGVQEARSKNSWRDSGSGAVRGNFRADNRTHRSRVYTDSVFESEGPSVRRKESTDQLARELEEMRIARSRFELDDERRYGRERQRVEKLESSLEKARDEVIRLSTQLAEVKRENCNLRLDNDRVQHNNQEAWNIIRAEWRRRDDEQARRERRERKDKYE